MAGSLLCFDANVLHIHFNLSCRSWLAALSAVSQQLSRLDAFCYRMTFTQVIGLVLLGTHQSSHVESLYITMSMVAQLYPDKAQVL